MSVGVSIVPVSLIFRLDIFTCSDGMVFLCFSFYHIPMSSSQPTKSIHRPRYCTVHVYAVNNFCDSEWSYLSGNE